MNTPISWLEQAFTALRVKANGVLLAPRPTIEFVGTGVTSVDVPNENLTRVTIPTAGPPLNYVSGAITRDSGLHEGLGMQGGDRVAALVIPVKATGLFKVEFAFSYRIENAETALKATWQLRRRTGAFKIAGEPPTPGASLYPDVAGGAEAVLMGTSAIPGAACVTLTATDASGAPLGSLVSYELLLVSSAGYVVFPLAAENLPSGQLSVAELG